MYESPIKIFYSEITTQFDNEIFKAVQRVNITVDRDEIIRALRYDREQYQKGFDDARKDAVPVVHGQWEWLGPNRLVTGCMCGTCSACGVRSKYIVNTMVCPNCGARMNGGEDCADD